MPRSRPQTRLRRRSGTYEQPEAYLPFLGNSIPLFAGNPLALDAGTIVSGQRIVVIGGSAGGVEALFSIAGSFPAKFAAPIFITIHVPATAPSILPTLIARRGALPAKHAEDGERYKAGMIYVAPPDRHLLIGPKERLRVVRGPRENRHRPAIDPLFRSAATVAGSNVIAVVLSGALDDGTAGAIAVKDRGGAVVVQDPAEALHASMPQSVIANVTVDAVVSLRDLPR